MEQIKQHLIDKWAKEAKSLFWYDIDDNKVHQHLKDGQQYAYIEGCKSRYLEMVGEQERLKGLLIERVTQSAITEMFDKCDGEIFRTDIFLVCDYFERYAILSQIEIIKEIDPTNEKIIVLQNQLQKLKG